MDSLLVSISNVENSLTLVENLIQNILIYELPKGDLILNLKFQQSENYDTELIGGLTATIQEFAKSGETDHLKSISLEEINLIFISHKKFLVVYTVDPNYPLDQFKDTVEAFIQAFDHCLRKQEYGTTVDGAAVAVQTIHNLISEDIQIEMELGSVVTIYPFKLRELADKTAQELLGLLDAETTSKEDIPIETIKPENAEKSIDLLLTQFLKTFTDVKEVSIISTTISGEFEKYTKSRLDEEVSQHIYEIVMTMIDTVSYLLEQDVENRSIDLETDGIMMFQKISEFTFLYLVVDENTSIDTLEPIIERIGRSISKHLPDDLLS